MAASMVQLFGHSFVTRLKTFIAASPDLDHRLSLRSQPLIQFSGFPGADCATLLDKVEVIQDFDPHIVVLLVGTIDVYDRRRSPADITADVCELVRVLLSVGVQRVIVCQMLYRTVPRIVSRFPVLFAALPERFAHQACLWRMKGFWTSEAQERCFCDYGVHLTPHGQIRLIQNLRAAVVASLNSI